MGEKAVRRHSHFGSFRHLPELSTFLNLVPEIWSTAEKRLGRSASRGFILMESEYYFARMKPFRHMVQVLFQRPLQRWSQLTRRMSKCLNQVSQTDQVIPSLPWFLLESQLLLGGPSSTDLSFSRLWDFWSMKRYLESPRSGDEVSYDLPDLQCHRKRLVVAWESQLLKAGKTVCLVEEVGAALCS